METEVVGDPGEPTVYDWHVNWGQSRGTEPLTCEISLQRASELS